MSAREWTGWIAGALIVAVLVHTASVWALPHVVMRMALNRMGSINTIHHQSRVTAKSRGIVRPSPDLLYSACPFDLSNGALEVQAPIPPETYWSASAFDANTDNFFAINDRTVGGQPLELIILPPAQRKEPEHIAGQLVIHAPTVRGLVLFRTLINDEKNSARIDAVRRQARCGTYPLTALARSGG
jgi:uncharacterized membrane protein